jgi:hypothetical protein
LGILMFYAATLEHSATHGPLATESLPSVFCWTKMGAEAGQGLGAILRRKEFERLSGNGVFAWGIGNSVGPAIRYARTLGIDALDVLFTPMKSAPKAMDVAPSTLVLWTAYEDELGRAVALPAHLLVTSRGDTAEHDGLKKLHYALICRSDRSLLAPAGDLAVDASSVCNLVSRNPTGASQVTAVVRTCASSEPRRLYPVQFRANLTGLGFVRLLHGVPVTGALMTLYRDAVAATCITQWQGCVDALRRAARPSYDEPTPQGQLFGA